MPGTQAQLAAAMQAFDRMHEPHEACEDSVVFPAFRRITPAGKLADLASTSPIWSTSNSAPTNSPRW
jgi:hypothetical protein